MTMEEELKVKENTLSGVVNSLCDSEHGMLSWKGRGGRLLPSRDVVVEEVEELRSALFPGYFGVSEINEDNMRYHVGATLDRVLLSLREQIRRGLCFECDHRGPECPECADKAEGITRAFLNRLPAIQHTLATDVRAAYLGDPAAKSTDEAIFCYPGILAMAYYRMAHELHLLRVPLIPRIITERAHSLTGIDIHPGASIGSEFFVDHGTGVVIGETCEIGNRVRIYQGVTLGARSFPLDEHGHPVKGIPRHPIVEDEVVIYSGATVLGRVTIGRGSVIGANVWVTRDVPPGTQVTR
jgi:serine O-acetyltransferase